MVVGAVWREPVSACFPCFTGNLQGFSWLGLLSMCPYFDVKRGFPIFNSEIYSKLSGKLVGDIRELGPIFREPWSIKFVWSFPR